jgi:hypothetical protein
LEEESQTYYAGIIYATKNERIYDEISERVKIDRYIMYIIKFKKH